MHFEHLIEINDRDNPLVPDLTREELWFGLLCRAENPRPFLPGLDSCRIIERSDSELVRDLHFGATVIRDKVTLEAMASRRPALITALVGFCRVGMQ